MNKVLCIDKIKNYIVNSGWNISIEDFEKDGLVIKENQFDHAIKIIGINKATIVSVSKNLLQIVREEFVDKCRDIIFECPLTYGQTIFYIPDFKQNKKIDSKNYILKCFTTKEDINKLSIPKSFDNSIILNENNECISDIVYVAYDNNKIVGCCGAIQLIEGIFEMGIDVLPEYQNQGLATLLTTNLRLIIQEIGIIPVWRSSITNIGSQAVAQKSGFVPLYVSSFGTIGDKFYPYKKMLKIEKDYNSPISRV